MKLKYYLLKYNKSDFAIVFHGGEPMLAGKRFFRNFIYDLKKNCPDIIFQLGIQTNGVLIDKEWALFFKELDINVGISIDVTKDSNDKYRIYPNGHSAYEEIVNGINALYENNETGGGLLSVIDYNQLPQEVYNHLKKLNTRAVNLLFPDDNYSSGFIDDLKLGKWLSEIFDIWINDDNKFGIQQFEKLMGLMIGVDTINDEYYGKGRPNTFILETNGELQANDPIRVCKNGYSKTKLNIFDNEIDDLYQLPIGFIYYNNHHNLCNKCNNCPIQEICGGGYIINRFSTDTGFDNPSIYCKSLAYFISHVQNYLVDTIDKEVIEQCDIEKIDFNEILYYLNDEKYEPNLFLQGFK